MSDEESPKPEPRPVSGIFRPIGHNIADPDRACFGCLIGIAMILVSIGVWGYIYWLNEPAFHVR